MFLRIAYTVFIGMLLATFVGVGIAAFYPSPKPPKADFAPYPEKLGVDVTPQEQEARNLDAKRNQEAWETHSERIQNYSRNVSIIALIGSVVILGLGLTLVRHIYLISDGLLLGGVLTLIYSIARGFGSNNNMFQFAVVSVGLLAALILGYIKFVSPQIKTQKGK